VRPVAAAFEFSPLLRVEMNRLHRASLRAGFGPFGEAIAVPFLLELWTDSPR
jgi:hypothetical protein